MCMRTSYFGIQMESPRFTDVLGSAVLEWLLIILLFINALFSYLVTKFARFCKLPVPCLLCSRLDHVLGNKKPGFYRDLICKSHKLEISSLAFCNTHNKLADVHGLCEGCLFSFATENKSNSETCRLLVGKLGIDPECRSNQDQLPEDTKLDSSSERQCTCCKESWSLRSYTHSFLQTKSVEPEVSELEDPLLGSVGTSHLHSGDDLKKRREETSDLVTSSNVRSNSFDPLSRIGYTELKITSDSESEAHFSDDNGSPLVREIDGVKEEVVVQCNPLSRIGYTELKITSDSDSEAHFSDNDGGSPLVREIDGFKEEVVVQCNQPDEAHTTIPENLLEIPSNDLAPEKLIHQDFVPESSLLFPDVQRDVEKLHDETSLASAIAIGHGLEELNWHEEQKATPSPPPEFISKHEIAPSTDVEEALVDVHGLEELNWHEEQKATRSPPPELISKNEISPSVDVEEALVDVHGLEELNWHVEQKTTPSPPSELISKHEIASSDNDEEALIDVPDLISKHEIAPSVNVEEALVDDSAEILDVEETGKSEEACKSDSELTKTTGTGLKKDLVLNIKIPPIIPNLMDLSEAYKLAIGNRSPVVGLLGEQLTGKSSLRDKDDQKLLMSQVSATRGLDSPLNGMSPRVHGLAEELKIYDDSSSMGLHVLQKRISLERNESGLSLDGSLVSEIEGESVVDRLRRQVEYDRKSMYALYRELEEERNASAVSANQAMAMITRLQEEKSTLHMEALQYLRMMEEQSEYDVEALQKANDLLVEKEKELQDLEAELEVYRNHSDSYEKILKASHLKGGDMGAGHSGIRCIENEASVSCDATPGEKSQGTNNTEKNDGMYGGKYNISKDSLLDFEDERLYISQCLEKLEKQLHLFSNNGVHLDIPNGEYTPKEPSEPDNLEQLHFSKPTQESSQVEEDGFSGQKDSSLSRGHSQEMSTPLVGDTLVDSNVHNHSDGQDATLTNETDLVALENEVFDLNERLKALEADRNFLEHTINSLRNGDEGVKFIQEIANHLQELRKIGIRREQVIL